MRYLIIGLGIYGSNLAVDLTNMGHEVSGADTRASIVESTKDKISTAYILDSTDESSLKSLPLSTVDIVIVAIGENFGASVRTVALLKNEGVRHIYARAIDQLHYSILEGFGIDRIITPEQRAARDLVCEMALGSDVESMCVGSDVYVLRFIAPAYFHGMRYADIGLQKDYGLTLVAVSRKVLRSNIVGMKVNKEIMLDIADPDINVENGDTITVAGHLSGYRNLCHTIGG